MKICSKCGLEKIETDFRKWRTGCKACEKVSLQEYRAIPEIREHARKYAEDRRKDPKFKAEEAEKRHTYNQRPEVKAKRAEYRKLPHVRAVEVAHYQKYNARTDVRERNRKAMEMKRQDPEVRISDATKSREAARKKRKFINLLKMERPCYDCGGMFPPEATDWDHLPGHTKLFNIGPGVGTRSLEDTIKEIDKCQLVCASCHRLRTLSRRRLNGDVKVSVTT